MNTNVKFLSELLKISIVIVAKYHCSGTLGCSATWNLAKKKIARIHNKSHAASKLTFQIGLVFIIIKKLHITLHALCP